MNIILAEEHSGRAGTETSFSKAAVLVGRDANECDVSFDNTRYPMVSRKHAELRWEGEKWYVADLGSSYGTYINGQKIDGAAEIAVGDQIQFGLDGPAVRVIWFEVASDDEWAIDAAPTPVQAPRSDPPRGSSPSVFVPQPISAPAPPAAVSREPAKLEFVGGAVRPEFIISQPTIWIGRDPACEIVFDASSATVSRRHASMTTSSNSVVIADNNSFNGTLVNGQRISSPTELHHGDEVQFGLGGPVLRLNSPRRISPQGSSVAVQRIAASSADISSKTMVVKLDQTPARRSESATDPQLIKAIGFEGKNTLSIGRAEGNDIRLDGLQISNRHARLLSTPSGIVIEDLNSTNGLFVNGTKAAKQSIGRDDSVQIGTFLIRVEPSGEIGVYDTRSKTRIDVVALTRDVKGRFGSGKIRLFDSISLSIKPNEFVGLLGPSGAGKSTLMEALAGVHPATAGNVLINNLDLYRHLDSLKQSIGYVPQDDIIHRELTVYRTLYYVAKLRLSRDVSSAEISAMIEEVLDVTGLTDRRDVPVHKLSGGQRKRVSIAVELVTKPSVIFLDEPTSGLDPATEDKIMKLFRNIAESGRTVIMTTHAMENVRLFDKIVVLMRGRLVFFGKPDEALKHLGAANFKDLYEKLEDAADGETASQSGTSAERAERAATGWQQKFATTPQYREYIAEPLKELGGLPKSGTGKRRRLGIFGSIRQWATLSRRYIEVLLKDKLNLFILLAQAPIIALMTFFVMNRELPRDFVYFVVALVAIWFGLSVAAREIIRERPVYRRERMFNLGILPYLASKLFVLGVIVTVQCFFLFVPLKIFDLAGVMSMPGEFFGAAQFWAMLLTAGVGVALGLFVSAVVRTPEVATSIIPLILIPQILFSGLVGVPTGISKVAGLLMPSAWAFDTMKRFSTLDTLEPEGAKPRGETKGLGLYEFIESENDRTLEKAERDVEDFKRLAAGESYDGSPESPLNEKLTVPEMKKLPEDRSKYVTFLHPWMNEVLNQFVLMLMFGILVIATLIALKLKDRE